MKKILIFGLFSILSFGLTTNVMAQAGELKTASGIAFDSVSNAATTKYLYTPEISGKKEVASISLKAVKVSGTVSGTATLEASNDGTDWYPYYNSMDSSHSYNLTDLASQGYRWKLSQTSDLKFRVKIVVSGTQVARVTGFYRFR